MPIVVHFRGVGVLVSKKASGVATEVLFPRADVKPVDGTTLHVHNPADPSHDIEVLRHADGSVANKHFAGALLVAADGTTSYHLLMNRRVDRKGGGGIGASMGPAVILPPLDDIVVHSDKKLRLKKARSNDVVSTEFVLRGGTITAESFSGQKWDFRAKNGSRGPQDYSLEITWTFTEPEVVFEVKDLTGGGPPEEIKLDATCPTAYFYHFDVAMPTEKQLTTVNAADKDEVDNDFKWIYGLFKNVKNESWPDWLAATDFPAPTQFQPPLLPVSTCFDLVWTGAVET